MQGGGSGCAFPGLRSSRRDVLIRFPRRGATRRRRNPSKDTIRTPEISGIGRQTPPYPPHEWLTLRQSPRAIPDVAGPGRAVLSVQAPSREGHWAPRHWRR